MSATSKLVKAWESKTNQRAVKAGGGLTMALTLAACGGSDSTTTTPAVETPVETPAVPEALSFTLSSAANSFNGEAGADTFTAATAAVLQSFDVLNGGDGADTLTITDVADAYEGATGVGGTISNIENLTVNSSGGFGAVAADAIAAGTASGGTKEVQTVAITAAASIDVDDIAVTVNGVVHNETTLGLTIDNITTVAALHDQIDAMFDLIYGAAVTTANTNTATTVTAAEEGVDLGDVSITFTDAASATHTAGITATADPAVATAASASAAKMTITLGGTAASGDAYTLNYDGSIIAVVTTATQTDAATAIANAINGIHGSDIATAAGTVVTVVGPEGVALPAIAVDVSQSATATEAYIQPATTTVSAAVDAVDEAVFDASGFSGEVNLTAADDIVVKAAATADVTITSSAGSVDVDGGATVNIDATGAVDVMGNKITSAVVKTGTGTGDTVNIGATSGTAADTPLLETASVTGGTTITVIDEKDNTSSGTLTKVDLAGIGGTATLTGKALTEVNLGAQTTSQTINVVNGASEDHVLSLSVADTGIDADAADQQVTVVDNTAKTVALTVNGTDNDILIDGDASLTTLTVTGAAAAGIELHSSTAVTSIDASAATGDIDLAGVEAVAVTIKTGSGDDTFTTAATAALTVDAGAGDDVVTLNAATAKGSTIDLGAGNDDLLIGPGPGSVATDDASTVTNAKITVIDGGDGTDMVAATFITNGNADQFVNFEVLGLNGATLDTSLIDTASLELISTGGTYTNVKTSESLAVVANAGTSATTLTFATAEVAGTSDDFDISFAAKGATDSTAAAPTNIDAGTIVIEGVEDVTISSGQASGFVDNEIDLTGANIQTVTITGDADTTSLAFVGTNGTNVSAGGGAVNLIDASAVTGDTSINTTNVVADNATGGGLTVKGGSGIDTIVMAQGGTVYGNAGADVITTANAATTIYGGAGKDEFVVTSTTGSTHVKIMDLEVGDIIDFGTATAFGTAAVDVSAQTTLDGAIGAADGTDNKISYFDFGGDTYIVLADGTAGGITGDTVIQLDGDYDLSTATLASNHLTIA